MSATSTKEADALVIFGITGDLARKMTFRSLYRLERRGCLNVPVIGVAVVVLERAPKPAAAHATAASPALADC